MKKILIALCAVATLASCTKNEVLSYDQEAIGFENAFVDNSTRSVVDPSFANTADKMFDDFQVYGYVAGAPIFGANGVTVANTGTDGNVNWTYSGVQYWIADAIYNFSAVAPVTNGGWTKTAADKDDTTLSFTNDGDTDLLYAQNAEYRSKTVGTNGTVGFTFRHVLSKVKFSFENAYAATNSSIRVKDIKILDAYQNGSVVLDATTSTWAPVASSNNLILNFGNAALTVADNNATIDQNDKGYAFTVNNTVESYNELFMIPGAGQDVTVTNADSTTTTHNDVYTVQFTVELLVDGQEIKQYTHTIYTSFVPEPGKAYDLKAVISPESIDPEHQQEEIQFTVTTITDWDNDHDGKEGTTGTDTDGDNQVDTPIQ